MPLALSCCERRGDIVDVRETARPLIHGLRAIRNRPPAFLHRNQAASEGLVHDLLPRPLERLPEMLDPGGNVVVEG